MRASQSGVAGAGALCATPSAAGAGPRKSCGDGLASIAPECDGEWSNAPARGGGLRSSNDILPRADSEPCSLAAPCALSVWLDALWSESALGSKLGAPGSTAVRCSCDLRIEACTGREREVSLGCCAPGASQRGQLVPPHPSHPRCKLSKDLGVAARRKRINHKLGILIPCLHRAVQVLSSPRRAPSAAWHTSTRV